jgi:hypothetical protein
MNNLISKLGGRKFILCLVTEVLTAILVWYKAVDQGAYTTITLAIIGGYITGNVMQKKMTKLE